MSWLPILFWILTNAPQIIGLIMELLKLIKHPAATQYMSSAGNDSKAEFKAAFTAFKTSKDPRGLMDLRDKLVGLRTDWEKTHGLG